MKKNTLSFSLQISNVILSTVTSTKKCSHTEFQSYCISLCISAAINYNIFLNSLFASKAISLSFVQFIMSINKKKMVCFVKIRNRRRKQQIHRDCGLENLWCHIAVYDRLEHINTVRNFKTLAQSVQISMLFIHLISLSFSHHFYAFSLSHFKSVVRAFSKTK